MTQDFILGIDQGTTSSRALLFRRDGAVELHVYAAPDAFLECGDDDGEDVDLALTALHGGHGTRP